LFVSNSLGPRGGEEWYSRLFHIDTNPSITYGLKCNPEELLEYCHDLLCQYYKDSVKMKFLQELPEAFVKDAVQLQSYVNLLYTIKLVSIFCLWRKEGLKNFL
jgi:hypothetical protein